MSSQNNMKKIKYVILVISLSFMVISVMSFHKMFPEIGVPYLRISWREPSSPSENGSPYKHYYYELTNVEKYGYNQVLDKIYDMPEKIKVCALSEEELNNVFFALLLDNPDLFFVGRKCRVTRELWCDFFTIEYIMDSAEYEESRKKLDSQVNFIVHTLTDKNDARLTEKEIHDYIIQNCSYKLEKDAHIYSSAYGCLVNGKAGCEGYSKGAKMVLDKVGIESALITGMAKSSPEKTGAHMWNAVNLNGEWYNVDLTWDDPVSTGRKNANRYTYFNVSNETLGADHFDFSMTFPCNKDDNK